MNKRNRDGDEVCHFGYTLCKHEQTLLYASAPVFPATRTGTQEGNIAPHLVFHVDGALRGGSFGF